MNYVKPTGYTLKTPSTYYPEQQIIENSNRNANGKLIREIIAYKQKLNLTWNSMNADEMSVLAQLRKLGNFDCEYFDLETQTYQTISCYCGNVTATPIKTDNNGHVTHWSEISANFIEL